jgi:hypothetical protein
MLADRATFGRGIRTTWRHMAIYIKQGSTLIEMTEQPYDAEDVLQQLLEDHPHLLVGDADGERRKRWLLVKREIGVADDPEAGSRWSVDHLFLDEDGVPTLVETKRSSDTRIRREVVGQMLDYAANASSYWAINRIRDSYEATRRETGRDPDEDLAAHLGPDGDPEHFWEEVATNLHAGRIRLVFVADVIPRELRRIVEFLNERMTPTDVLAIEVRQYLAPGSDMITLVPRLIGQTEAARDVKRAASGRSRTKWAERDVIEGLRTSAPGEPAERMIALYEFVRDHGARMSWGTGVMPSVTMWLGEREDDLSSPIAVGIYVVQGGKDNIAINFDFVRDKRTPEEMQRFADLMRTIPGVPAYIQGLEQANWGMHRGMNPADVLGSDDALEAWKTALIAASRPA